ncbi:hypothetical protein F5B21DRAFT_147306 [Xylaria acuta]|nr:hypothetical protein F5B21DRAFT_147306 [Xylaria acuta]
MYYLPTYLTYHPAGVEPPGHQMMGMTRHSFALSRKRWTARCTGNSGPSLLTYVDALIVGAQRPVDAACTCSYLFPPLAVSVKRDYVSIILVTYMCLIWFVRPSLVNLLIRFDVVSPLSQSWPCTVTASVRGVFYHTRTSAESMLPSEILKIILRTLLVGHRSPSLRKPLTGAFGFTLRYKSRFDVDCRGTFEFGLFMTLTFERSSHIHLLVSLYPSPVRPNPKQLTLQSPSIRSV